MILPRKPFGCSGAKASGCLNGKDKAHEEIVVPLLGVDVEIHRLVGAVLSLSLLELEHELAVFV